MPYQLQLLGSPVLRKKTEPLDLREDRGEIERFLPAMRDILHRREGIGLAGPQANASLRVFLLDADRLPVEGHGVFINPEVSSSGREVYEEEGCLSIPGIFERVKRRECSHVEAYDERGELFSVDLRGLAARAAQHEFDHLEGVLFIDHLSPIIKRMLRKKLREIRAEAEKLGQVG
ncbi:peptide deformylase [Candidatus Fermentibacteria bacterium]|nr:peptide deformylase [Candidatus Fermentibacteria bacterium]